MGYSRFQSSLTKKYVIAFAGLFLIIFLFVHLAINLLALLPSTDTFNVVAHFMGTNVIIKVFEVALFGGFIIHIIYGLVLQIQNWLARPVRYKKEGWSHTSPFSKFMIHTAVIILVFLVIHMIDFYFKAKYFGGAEDVVIDGKKVHDLGALVIEKFRIPWYIAMYIVSFVILGFHLHHGFQSAFQSIGWNNKAYFPFLMKVSLVISIFLTLGFTAIPLIIYFGNY